MDREKWARYDVIGLPHYAIKLAEETGEVASEISDFMELETTRILQPSLEYAKRKKNCKHRRARLQNALDELDQVIFIAQQMRNGVLSQLETVNDEWAGMD